MANTVIRIKKSGVAGTSPASLNIGELALNYADGKLFYNSSVGIVTTLPYGSFRTILANSVSILANTATETLTINPGQDILLTANALTKTITITANINAANLFGNFANITANAITTNTTLRWANSITGVSAVYQYYNTTTNSLDTVFG